MVVTYIRWFIKEDVMSSVGKLDETRLSKRSLKSWVYHSIFLNAARILLF